MQLPKSFTTVTPLSKALALILFVSLPFVGFLLGYRYNKSISIIPSDVKVVETQRPSQEDLDKLESVENNLRCGQSPSLGGYYLTPNQGMDSYAVWSPDCRHIAWSTLSEAFFQFFPSPSNLSYEPRGWEGIFLYNSCNEEIDKVYTPETDTLYSFEKWLDSNSFIYNLDNQKYVYFVDDGSSQLLNN